jgi:hypothetical protein
MGLTETLMLLMSREFCCAGMVLRGGAGLRHRRHRWLNFGDEVREGQKHCASAGNIASGASSGTGKMSGKARRDRSRILGCFGTEGAVLLDMWLPPTCKEGTARRQGVPRVKVVRPYEDTLEACTTRGVTVIPL